MIDYRSLKPLPSNWAIQDSDIITIQPLSSNEPLRMPYGQFKNYILASIPEPPPGGVTTFNTRIGDVTLEQSDIDPFLTVDIPLAGTVDPVTGNLHFEDEVKLLSSTNLNNFLELNGVGENGINTLKINSTYLEVVSELTGSIKVDDGSGNYSQIFANPNELAFFSNTTLDGGSTFSAAGANIQLSTNGSGDEFTGIQCLLTEILMFTNAGSVTLTAAIPGSLDGSLVISTPDQSANQYSVTINKNGISLDTLGTGIRIKNGANGMANRAVLVGGTVTVSNNKVTAASNIIAFCQIPGGTPGWLRCSARVVGTSFTILSSSGTDTSTIYWKIEEPS